MDEILRLLAIQRGVQFPEHGMQVGDRVRMINAAGHEFKETPEYFKDGEMGTVVNTELFLGLMPVFEVKPDSGATITMGDDVISTVPFGNATDFATVVKIEE